MTQQLKETCQRICRGPKLLLFSLKAATMIEIKKVLQALKIKIMKHISVKFVSVQLVNHRSITSIFGMHFQILVVGGIQISDKSNPRSFEKIG